MTKFRLRTRLRHMAPLEGNILAPRHRCLVISAFWILAGDQVVPNECERSSPTDYRNRSAFAVAQDFPKAQVIASEGLETATEYGLGGQDRVIQFTDLFVRLGNLGEVDLRNFGTVKLAHVRMRDVNETLEPELIDIINRLIVKQSQQVTVCIDLESGGAVIYYDQPIYYQDSYGLNSIRVALSRRSIPMSINELVIAMAAAEYSPQASDCCSIVDACRAANEKYWLARTTSFRNRPLYEYLQSSCQLYTENDHLRARIAKGDIPKRDAYLEEGHKALEELGLNSGDASHSIPLLCTAIRHPNCIVRRRAAQLLAQMSRYAELPVDNLIASLQDPDMWVRLRVSWKLGEMGTDAKPALPELNVISKADLFPEVRQSAMNAILKIQKTEQGNARP